MADTIQPQSLTGVVIHGQQLGRRLGFPTANLDVEQLQGELPASGVYAAWATLADGRRYPAMVNIGYRPTVDASCHALSVEAHLDGFSGDLYGQTLHLQITHRIRDERRMSSLEQLCAQLTVDLDTVRQCLTVKID